MSSDMAHVNGITIAYDTFGRRGDPPIMLVMGLGTQRIAWPDALCQQLAGSGRFVVRFDNRDAGESTHLADLGMPTALDFLLRRSPYPLDAMADDVVGLADALGLGDVHVVGASMGGFIAQMVAIRQPARVRTLTLLMTSTGSWRVGRAHPLVIWRLLRRKAASSRDHAMDEAVRTFRLIGSRGFPFDEAWTRHVAGLSYDRSYDPAGHRRQLAAIVAQPDRSAQLRGLAVPTLVIHGLADRLVNPTGGLALARAIPRSRFVGFSGMGHDLPRPLWGPIADEIARHTDRARDVGRDESVA